MAKSLPLINIGRVENGRFISPTLYRKSKDKVWEWYGVTYATLNGVETDITPFLPNEINPYGAKTTAHGHFYPISGQIGGKHPNRNPTNFTTGTNIGKKNEVSAVVAAINKLHTDYEKKIKEGYVPEIDETERDFDDLIRLGKSRVFV
jgi:hypothetical protein